MVNFNYPNRMGTMGESTLKSKQADLKEARRILLLEDDEQLGEIIKDFLTMHDYEVVVVSNGVEGVREIIARDFEAIVCDIMMPKLAGDMFYLAVERMRPNLCDRFVFITGQRENPKVMDFINKTGSIVLIKPFPMNDLLDLIGFVQLRVPLDLI